MARPSNHVLLNGMSIGGGGGYTVGREWLRHLATQRPDWAFTMVLTAGHPLHEELRRESLPPNARLLWAPPATAGRLARARYERTEMLAWAAQNGVAALVQLTGVAVPGCRLPTLMLMQDPWPYKPEAWDGMRDRVLAALKRRRHARALREADFVVWTSNYIRDLVAEQLGVRPRRDAVLYNGVPDEWIRRAQDVLPDWASRPLELLSVSNVSPYKRQDLVVRALPDLIARPGLESLIYRVVGHCDERYRAELVDLARRLNVSDRVRFEGRVPDDAVRERMLSAKCFVLMSVCESFGIPAVEAMSFGTPVVTSDCCAMPEVCGDGADLCPADNVAALTERLARVLLDARHAEDLRRRGAARVAEFGWSATGARLASILEDLTAAASPVAAR